MEGQALAQNVATFGKELLKLVYKQADWRRVDHDTYLFNKLMYGGPGVDKVLRIPVHPGLTVKTGRQSGSWR